MNLHNAHESFAEVLFVSQNLPVLLQVCPTLNYLQICHFCCIVWLVRGTIQALGDEKGCRTGQFSPAWLMSQGDDIIPIPGAAKIPKSN